MAAAVVVGAVLNHRQVPIHADAAPLYAVWLPHLGPGTPLAVAVAASSPPCAAAPKPRLGTRTTVAPYAAARSGDPSVEPLSATIARYPAGIRDSTQGSAAASSRQGSTTSTGSAMLAP